MVRGTFSTEASFGESLVRHSQASTSVFGETTRSLLDDPHSSSMRQPPEPPDMWAWDKAALYSHYACIGVVNGLLTQALLPYCLYIAHGEPNTSGIIRFQHVGRRLLCLCRAPPTSSSASSHCGRHTSLIPSAEVSSDVVPRSGYSVTLASCDTRASGRLTRIGMKRTAPCSSTGVTRIGDYSKRGCACHKVQFCKLES